MLIPSRDASKILKGENKLVAVSGEKIPVGACLNHPAIFFCAKRLFPVLNQLKKRLNHILYP
jgi:hypothetical protein